MRSRARRPHAPPGWALGLPHEGGRGRAREPARPPRVPRAMDTPAPRSAGPARPRIVLSRCLELDACRYNGAAIRAPLVRRLEDHVELIPICPEVEVGLGVPRDPIR